MAARAVVDDRAQLGVIVISSGCRATVPELQRRIVTSPAEWYSLPETECSLRLVDYFSLVFFLISNVATFTMRNLSFLSLDTPQ